MSKRVALACVISAIAAVVAQAQVTIRVIRQDDRKPVANARVKIEDHPGRELLGKKGETDENGLFVSDKIPADLTKIYINIDPRETNLKAVVEPHPAHPKAIIIIVIPRQLK